MNVYEVNPHIGVGPIKLGMKKAAARQSMGQPVTSFKKGPFAKHETDAFHENAFQIFYGGDEPVVDYIELSRDAQVVALFNTMDVFATPADELVAALARLSPYDEDHSEGYSYIFPALDLSLWRPVLPEYEGDEEGRYFSTIGIGEKGYYSGGGV